MYLHLYVWFNVLSWFFYFFILAIIKRKRNDVISNERKSTNDLQKRWFFFMGNLFLFLFLIFILWGISFREHTHTTNFWFRNVFRLLSSRRHCQSSFQNNYNKNSSLFYGHKEHSRRQKAYKLKLKYFRLYVSKMEKLCAKKHNL